MGLSACAAPLGTQSGRGGYHLMAKSGRHQAKWTVGVFARNSDITVKLLKRLWGEWGGAGRYIFLWNGRGLVQDYSCISCSPLVFLFNFFLGTYLEGWSYPILYGLLAQKVTIGVAHRTNPKIFYQTQGFKKCNNFFFIYLSTILDFLMMSHPPLCSMSP